MKIVAPLTRTAGRLRVQFRLPSLRPEAFSVDGRQKSGGLLVLESDRLVGVLSERDYARKVILMGKSSKDTLAREIMSENVVVTPGRSIEECMILMTENRIRHLLLVENDGVGGVISIGAAVKAIIFEQECMIEQLEHDASM